jgi:hypothetical protein
MVKVKQFQLSTRGVGGLSVREASASRQNARGARKQNQLNQARLSRRTQIANSRDERVLRRSLIGEFTAVERERQGSGRQLGKFQSNLDNRTRQSLVLGETATGIQDRLLPNKAPASLPVCLPCRPRFSPSFTRLGRSNGCPGLACRLPRSEHSSIRHPEPTIQGIDHGKKTISRSSCQKATRIRT